MNERRSTIHKDIIIFFIFYLLFSFCRTRMSQEVQYHSVDSKLDTIFQKTLPDSLNQLSKRNESFAQIVKHLESEYNRTGVDKENVEKEAKSFVVKGLTNILADIELAAININQLVDLQTTTLESLSSQVDVVQTRLSTLKSQHLLFGLDEMKHSSSAKVPEGAKNSGELSVSVQDMKDDMNRSKNSVDEESEESKTNVVYKRIPLEQRLSKLSNIGLGSASAAKQ